MSSLIQIEKFGMNLWNTYQIHVHTGRNPSLAPQQNIAIQEKPVVVAKISPAVAPGAEIVGVVAAIEASDANEVKAVELHTAAVAPYRPGLDDVVEGHDLPEVQTAVVVGVELRKHVGFDPIVAVLAEETGELIEADPSVAVGVHGFEEIGG